MVTLSETEVGKNSKSDGQAIAPEMHPAELEMLVARRRGAKAGFAKHLFSGVDLNTLLETSLDDVFEGYR